MHLRFGCVANSIRSQMAEGAFRSLADESMSVSSAGVFAHNVDPTAIEVMNEIGVDISSYNSKCVDDPCLPTVDVFVDLTQEAFHSKRFGSIQEVRYIHHPVDDPVAVRDAAPEIRLPAFRETRDKIFEFIRSFLVDLLVKKNITRPGYGGEPANERQVL